MDIVCSDLHKFLETNKDGRNEFINGLIDLFPREKNDIAPYRKGDVGTETLAKWVFAHPTCIPLLTKCLEKYEKGKLERMKTKAKEYGTSAWKINTDAGKFFKVWGISYLNNDLTKPKQQREADLSQTDYENVSKGTTLERISKIEDTTKVLFEHVLTQGQILAAQSQTLAAQSQTLAAQSQTLAAQNVHIVNQGKKIQELHTKLEFVEQELHKKDMQIKTLIEENEKLKQALAKQAENHSADQQTLVRKIEELEKEKKVLKESRNDLREKLEEEKVKRQAEETRMMQDDYALKMNIDDMDEIGSDEFVQVIIEKPK